MEELNRQMIGRVSLIGSITPSLGWMPTNGLTIGSPFDIETKEAIFWQIIRVGSRWTR